MIDEPNLEEEKLVAEVRKCWTKVMAWSGPITNTSYAVYLSPDCKTQIGIHEYDNEIIGIMDAETHEMKIPTRDLLRNLLRLVTG